jgi:hypothetical protein
MPLLDLAAKRAERTKTAFDDAVDAAQDTAFVLDLGDGPVATLGKELPLTALAPLRQIDAELSLLFGRAMDMATGNATSEGLTFILDLLAAYPDLPTKALDIVAEIGTNLLGQPGWEAFLAFKPSLQDGMALLSGLTDWYGVSLGEASGSSVSPEIDGTTSTTTSDDTSESTPQTHYDSGTTTDSSAPDA